MHRDKNYDVSKRVREIGLSVTKTGKRNRDLNGANSLSCTCTVPENGVPVPTRYFEIRV
jgi:hypothetical protein